jgi:peptidyl-prolyl cis-trans isomerase D
MAVIQKIRDKYAKVAGGVIVVALLSFILADYAKGGNSGPSTTIGKVNGDKIDASEYQAAIQQREEQMKQQNQNGTIDDNQTAQIREEVFNQMVNDRLLTGVEDKLGITVTKGEETDLLTGSNPDPQIKQIFTDPKTGVFNPQEVAARIAQIKKDPKTKGQWDVFVTGLLKARHAAKFNALVSGAIYTPKFILDATDKDRNTIAKINYVKLPYTLVPDASVKVTDDEIKKYLESHKAMFTVKEPMRGIDFVAFNIVPSSQDTAKAMAELEKIKAEFATSTDDEAFVTRNSQSQIPVSYYTKAQMKNFPNVEEISNAPVGSIVGPFYDGSNYMLAKIKDQKVLPDSIKFRQIVVATKAIADGMTPLSDAAAKTRIDSVIAMSNGGVPFDSLAARYSDDPNNKATADETQIVLAQRAQLPKDFGDFVFEGHTGEKKMIKTDVGYYYIEILDQKAPTSSSKIAFIAHPFNYSDSTSTALYAAASSFAGNAKNGATFDNVAKAKGYNVASADGLNKNSFVINNLGSSRDLVKWAYDAKLGDVSPVYTIGGKYIVAKLSNVLEAGLAPINDKTRPYFESYVRNDKKAEILKGKVKGQATLEAIAQSQGQQVGAADSVNFAQGFVPGVGQEMKVVGYAFNKSFKPNTLSPAISGREGVYFINLVGISALPAQPRNIDMERKMSDYQMKANAAQLILSGLKDASEVKDNRSELY